MSDDYIEDGFGSSWEKCGPHCLIEVVRPGKAQCLCDNPSSIIGDAKMMAAALRKITDRDCKCPICGRTNDFHDREVQHNYEPQCPLSWWSFD